MHKMTEQQANRVYDVLMATCGASELLRAEFVHLMQIESMFPHEYRFSGKLAFGGKLTYDGRKAWVSYYREDRSPERDSMVERANNWLKGVL